MSRAYGWNAQLLIAQESQYGILPTTGFRKIPFSSSTIDSEQGLIASNVLGLGRDPTQPFQDIINVGGELSVPVDLRNIGIWLKSVFGDGKTSEDEGTFTHVFESGKSFLPSFTLELGLPEIPEFIRFVGVKANSIAFNFARSGEAQVTVSLLAQGEVAGMEPLSINPELFDYTRFSQFQGFIKSNGQVLANITSSSLTYSNNLEKIETIRNDGKVEAIDLGVASLSGNIAARYGDNILMTNARSGEPVDLEMGYVLSDKQKLILTCHEVYLPKPKRSINGPGGIECSYDFQGAKDGAISKMMTVTLVNDVENY
ncbi:MAG: phage tail tube protein [Alphaproteobacteria bacterium]